MGVACPLPERFPCTVLQGVVAVDIPSFDGSERYRRGLEDLANRVEAPDCPAIVLRFPGHADEVPVDRDDHIYRQCLEMWHGLSARAGHTVRVSVSRGGSDVFAGMAFCQHVVLIDNAACLNVDALGLPGMAALLARRSDSIPSAGEMSAADLLRSGLADAGFAADDDGVLDATIKNTIKRRAGIAGIGRAIALLRRPGAVAFSQVPEKAAA